MTRRAVEVRREEILVATVAAIEENGMATLRVIDVARELGVSSGLVFYHFAAKSKLLAAALELAVERDLARLDAALGTNRPPVEALNRVLATYGPTGAARGWRLWIDAWATALREPAIRRALRRLDAKWREALRQVIGAGVTSGDFRCPDPDATVARIGALLDGLSVAALVYGSVSRAQLRIWVRTATATELGVEPEVLGGAAQLTPASSAARRRRSVPAGPIRKR